MTFSVGDRVSALANTVWDSKPKASYGLLHGHHGHVVSRTHAFVHVRWEGTHDGRQRSSWCNEILWRMREDEIEHID